jgi:hypothetical protein
LVGLENFPPHIQWPDRRVNDDERRAADIMLALRRQRNDAMQVARAFVEAARNGDVRRFVDCAGLLEEQIDAWRLAMRGVARLPAVRAEIQLAFIDIWVERKHLPLTVGHRPTMAKAARKLFPGGTMGSSMRLYRGTSRLERRTRHYGFSWTTQQDMALQFATMHSDVAKQLAVSQYFTGVATDFLGVVLETVAPANAILLMREDEDHYDEAEIVVDPFHLAKVTIAS